MKLDRIDPHNIYTYLHVLQFLAAKAAPISRNVRSLVSQSVSKQIKKTQ